MRMRTILLVIVVDMLGMLSDRAEATPPAVEGDTDCRKSQECKKKGKCYFDNNSGRCISRGENQEDKADALREKRNQERNRLIDKLENASLAQREQAAIRLCTHGVATIKQLFAVLRARGLSPEPDTPLRWIRNELGELDKAKLDASTADMELAEAIFRGIAEQMEARGASALERARLQSTYSRNCTIR